MVTDKPVRLENQIMDYAWGSKTAIQKLLGKSPDHQTPWAELWMGAHPKAPSRIRSNGESIALDRVIRNNPENILGQPAARRFESTLPYLFKVLAAEQPLSIQAHPDRAEAVEGFARENRLNIPMDAPERSYKDPWPKPECICALEPFIALNGFRPAEETVGLLQRFCPVALRAEIDALADSPDAAGIKTFFEILLTLPDNRREEIIREAAGNADRNESEESFWLKRLHAHYPGDIGILSPLFLHLIRLEPGQAMFLPPGRMHAYLYGVGIELMANSDNVLRGGLTKKHMDVAELMRVLRFDPSPVEILAPEPVGSCEKRYLLDVDEFSLSVITPHQGLAYDGPETHSAEILLCLEGDANLLTDNMPAFSMSKGNAVLIPAAAGAYRIEGNAMLYKAAVPV